MRYGMEVELSQEHFAKLTGLFDYDKLQARYGISAKFPERIFDHYLFDNPQALAALTPELRERLTKGLKLQGLIDQSRAVPLQAAPALSLPKSNPALSVPQGLLGADGKPLASASAKSILIPESAPAPKDALALTLKKPEGLQVPARLDWAELNQRWKALPESEKAAAVQWEKLGPNEKARIILEILANRENLKNLQLELKPETSPAVKDLFSRLRVGRDGGGTIEIRHRDDLVISRPADFLSDVRAIAKLSGTESKIFRPDESRLQGIGFHYHISKETEANLTPLFELYNKYLLVKRVHAGIISDLSGNGKYLFNVGVGNRGLIRNFSGKHLEQRVHHGLLEEEFSFIDGLMMSDPEESKAFLNQEIRRLLDAPTIKRFVRYGSDRAQWIAEFIDENLKNKLLNRRQRVAKLFAGKDNNAVLRRVPSLLKSPDRMLNSSALIYLRHPGKELPETFWNSLPSLFGNLAVEDEVFELIASSRFPVKAERAAAMEKILRTPFPAGEAAQAENRQASLLTAWSKTWQENEQAPIAVLGFLRDSSLPADLRRKAAVKAFNVFPEEGRGPVLQALLENPQLKKDSGQWLLSLAALEHPAAQADAELVKAIRAGNPQSSALRDLIFSLARSGQASPEIVMAVADYLPNSGLGSEACEYLLRHQPELSMEIWKKLVGWLPEKSDLGFAAESILLSRKAQFPPPLYAALWSHVSEGRYKDEKSLVKFILNKSLPKPFFKSCAEGFASLKRSIFRR